MIVVTAAGGPTGTAVTRALRAAHRLRRTFDHYRRFGFTGSPRVLEALLGRPARTLADHLRARPLPGATGELR